ncbi:uncharacterized protein [Narcine bancroftii]|uniref:uncharacterized protein isoform X9 n=1 Tax=Narcine bancroftii TaxID=1343680 RepID=UPI00383193C4
MWEERPLCQGVPLEFRRERCGGLQSTGRTLRPSEPLQVQVSGNAITLLVASICTEVTSGPAADSCYGIVLSIGATIFCCPSSARTDKVTSGQTSTHNSDITSGRATEPNRHCVQHRSEQHQHADQMSWSTHACTEPCSRLTPCFNGRPSATAATTVREQRLILRGGPSVRHTNEEHSPWTRALNNGYCYQRKGNERSLVRSLNYYEVTTFQIYISYFCMVQYKFGSRRGLVLPSQPILHHVTPLLTSLS